MRDADRILVLEQGQVVASGRHGELLATSALYQQMSQWLSAPGGEAPV